MQQNELLMARKLACLFALILSASGGDVEHTVRVRNVEGSEAVVSNSDRILDDQTAQTNADGRWYQGSLDENQFVISEAKSTSQIIRDVLNAQIIQSKAIKTWQKKSEITYYYLSRKHMDKDPPDPANIYTTNDIDYVKFTIDSNQPALPDQIAALVRDDHRHGFGILIHGWIDGVMSHYKINYQSWMIASGIDWMNFGHVSIIVVNYSDIADGEYFFTSSQLGVSYVGDAVTRLLQLIMVECGVNLPVEQQSFLANISIAGHSLGAHIAGYVGFNMNRIYGYLIGIIYGIDPAGPQFRIRLLNITEQFRLNKRNALFVQILHTDSTVSGIQDLLGHADYFPNGGNCQPGCPCVDLFRFELLQATQCNHIRAIFFFRASMYLKAIGYKCRTDNCAPDFYTDEMHDTDVYGIHSKRKNGIFYMPVNAHPPFFHRDAANPFIPSHKIITPISFNFVFYPSENNLREYVEWIY